VTTKEEAYHIVRNGDAATGQWVLAEKGSYPVAPERVAQLTRALSAIEYARPMTRDEKKFNRIGLGSPADDGTGALLEVGDGSGTSFAKLIVGFKDGRSYVREPDDLQGWAVDEAVIPPLQRGAYWLDLEVVQLSADQILEVNVRPREGSWYTLLAGDDAGQSFRLAQPHARRQLITAFGPALTAQALTRFAPVDVAPAAGVATGAPWSQYVALTRSGVSISVQCWRKGDTGWVTLGAAVGERASPEAIVQAQGINARAAGWAFALTEMDWGMFAAPLDALAE
jgi:hypothetical protein